MALIAENRMEPWKIRYRQNFQKISRPVLRFAELG